MTFDSLFKPTSKWVLVNENDQHTYLSDDPEYLRGLKHGLMIQETGAGFKNTGQWKVRENV